ncbi:MAG: gamma-glutamyl-gamma-aminobutyrate hydrolase family protein [Propionibacteriales bacterium]|nr:gamma-glutamyl-gamma-aminobutyrate hydrolase family protein [Propionibacteriales bacterium]
MNHHLERPVIGITYSSKDLEGFGLWRHMFHGFVAAGATPVGIDCAVEQPLIASTVRRLDGLVVGGGGDVDPVRYGGAVDDELLWGVNPARDAIEEVALRAAFDGAVPVLAICRGMQFVNVALGGTLHADLTRDRPSDVVHRPGKELLDRSCHDVDVDADTLLSAWMGRHGRVAVNSEHHQGLDVLAPGLRGVAHSRDGLVEAVELPGRQLVGVQWHPEILWSTEQSSLDLLAGFVRISATRASANGQLV